MKQEAPGGLSQSYRTVNAAAAILAVYGLVLPFVLPELSRLLPEVFSGCASRRIFGIPCPLCGLTRGLREVMRGDIAGGTALNILAVPVFLLLLCELAYRLLAVFAGLPSRHLRLIVSADRWFHLILLGGYLCYSAVFIIRQF